MIGQRHIAKLTRLHVPAVTAHDEGGCAATVQKQDRLLLFGQHLVDGLMQDPAEHGPVSGAQLLAQVDHLHGRQVGHARFGVECIQRTIDSLPQMQLFLLLGNSLGVPHDAPRQLQQGDLAQLGRVEGLQRWRGRAQDHRGAGQPAELQGGVAGMVARCALALLVRWVVFLVQHDQAQPRQRQKQRRACAHHHVHRARSTRRQTS